MLKIKHIVFDLDGTLIETKDLHKDALNIALTRNGLNAISEEDHKKSYCGLPTKMKLIRHIGEDHPKFKNVLKDKQDLTELLLEKENFYDFTPLLTKLKDTGMKIGIASNAVRRSVDLMLAKCCPEFEFDIVMSNEDVVKSKPAPDMYVEIAKAWEIYPQEIVVVEDKFEIGVKSAIDAGCLVCLTKGIEETKDIITYIIVNSQEIV